MSAHDANGVWFRKHNRDQSHCRQPTKVKGTILHTCENGETYSVRRATDDDHYTGGQITAPQRERIFASSYSFNYRCPCLRVMKIAGLAVELIVAAARHIGAIHKAEGKAFVIVEFPDSTSPEALTLDALRERLAS